MISIILSNHFEDRSITLSKLNRAYNENKFEAIVLEMNYSIQMSILYNRIVNDKIFMRDQMTAIEFAKRHRIKRIFGLRKVSTSCPSHLFRHKSYINNDLCFVDCFESKPNYCESLNSSMIEAYEKFGNIAIIVGSQHMTHLIECCKRYKIDYKIFA